MKEVRKEQGKTLVRTQKYLASNKSQYKEEFQLIEKLYHFVGPQWAVH